MSETLRADTAARPLRTQEAAAWLAISQSELVRWRHGDFVFTPTFDIMSDTSALRRAGFHDVVDTEAMFFRLFDDYRRERIIP